MFAIGVQEPDHYGRQCGLASWVQMHLWLLYKKGSGPLRWMHKTNQDRQNLTDAVADVLDVGFWTACPDLQLKRVATGFSEPPYGKLGKQPRLATKALEPGLQIVPLAASPSRNAGEVCRDIRALGIGHVRERIVCSLGLRPNRSNAPCWRQSELEASELVGVLGDNRPNCPVHGLTTFHPRIKHERPPPRACLEPVEPRLRDVEHHGQSAAAGLCSRKHPRRESPGAT